MPLSWNEIKDRALAFSKEWADAVKESAEYQSYWNEFFEVFGVRRRSVAIYQDRVKKMSGAPGFIDLFWPSVLLIEHKSLGENLDSAFLQATDYILTIKELDRPRFVIVSDYQRLRLYDLEADNDVERVRECSLKEFPKHARMFGFIAGYTQKVYKEEEAVNVKAAELVAKLHDALRESGYEGHHLEMLLVRLVFCFFADDTDIFGEPSFFRNYLETRSQDDGSDIGLQIALIFQTLSTPAASRQSTLDEDLRSLPYVDGHLFEEQLPLPTFNAKMRRQIIDCCAFDWSAISPAVFGAMFQSAMDPEKRHELGAHYTSEKNILKVISGLFLDDVKEELEKADRNPAKLKELHDKIAKLTFLDPACGCGNFLVVTYRELRLVELEILRRLFFKALTGIVMPDVASLSKVHFGAMHGIEIEELPSRIASLALWLTDHQMNMMLREEFGQWVARLPLPRKATIVRDNALRIDWGTVIPKEELSYILGNPPFVGSKVMTSEQKADMTAAFGDLKGSGELDFVSAWYAKASDYIAGTAIRCAFVSTNSITQGEQVGILWHYMLDKGIKIHFAHRTFRWSNEARGKAAVFCVIIGFGLEEHEPKRIYEYENPSAEPHEILATNINPYLVDADDILISSRRKPLSGVPPVVFGSMPNDGGHLLFEDETKKNDFLKAEPGAAKFVRKFLGAREFLNGEDRWCLWLKGADPAELHKLPHVVERVAGVREHRESSNREATKKLAEFPTLFGEDRQPEADFVLIPRVSSESRRYIPMSFFAPENIAGDTCVIVPGATIYHFGVLQSLMHMAWVRQICGRLKSDYRYSNELVYNNFPWPGNPSTEKMTDVESAALTVLAARKDFPDATLADLYDPNTMPARLLKAHKDLDAAVDACYGKKKFASEPDRLKFLFELYQNKQVAS